MVRSSPFSVSCLDHKKQEVVQLYGTQNNVFLLPEHETGLLIHQDYLITFIGEVFSADHFLNIAGSKGVKASLSCRMTRWRRRALGVHTANIS